MGNKLEGKIAIITGGTSGIGLATAKRFVSEEAYVLITGLSQKDLDVAISDIGKNVSDIHSIILLLFQYLMNTSKGNCCRYFRFQNHF